MWRDPEPKPHYDVIIVGGGGHGLATAYYLAARYGVQNVAVLEKGYIGGGNSGRNTQVCRSDYFHPPSAAFYEHSLQLYESLNSDLDFNVMLSQRGNLELSHSKEDLEVARRWANAMQLNGIDSEMLSRNDLAREQPLINLDCHYRVFGAYVQRRAGISRHDAVVWAYARAASAAGVDIIQNCEVEGFHLDGDRIKSIRTGRGELVANHYALCVAGHSGHLAAKAGLRLPIESVALQAMVTQPVKPLLDIVIGSDEIHAYVSQSDRGEIVIGGGTDGFISYAQRGGLTLTQENAAAVVELLPCLRRLRVMRQWAGICDIAPDASPIVGHTPLDNLFISTGWGTGGFKAVPAGGDTLASTIARNRPHPLLEAFSLERFTNGRLVDEAAATGVAQ
jgi:sarcosine oxidase subunit beta